MPEEDEFQIGSKIGDYTIVGELGRGGMGVVYLAQHKYLKKRFALKVMPKEFSSWDAFAKLFQQEAQTLGNLKHSNIVEVHNFGIHEGAQYLVMDYVEGGTIEDYLKKSGGTLPSDEVVATLLAVLGGLKHAHDKGIMHRDLKPENFLLDWDGTVKITDFGLAQLMDAELGESQASAVRYSKLQSRNNHTMIQLAEGQSSESDRFTGGTEGYMAPEVVAGGVGDKRADFYAIGVIAHYLLTGHRPDQTEEKPSQLIPKLDKRWETLIQRCLEEEPDKRYQSADELIKDLEILGQPNSKRGLISSASVIATLVLFSLYIFLGRPIEISTQPSANESNPAKDSLSPSTLNATQKSNTNQASETSESVKVRDESIPDPLPLPIIDDVAPDAIYPTQAETLTDQSRSEDADTATEQALPSIEKNILKNGSFEDGLNAWTTVGGANMIILNSPRLAADRDHLARILNVNNIGMSYLSTFVNAQWGDRIIISAQVRNKTQAVSHSFESAIQMVAHRKNSSQPIGEKSQYVVGVSEWQSIFIDAKIPARSQWPDFDRIEIRLILNSLKNAVVEAQFDDIRVHRIPRNDPHYNANYQAPTAKKILSFAKLTPAPAPLKPTPKEKAPDPPPASTDLPPGTAQLTLALFDQNGNQIEDPMCFINGVLARALPGTQVYQFDADTEVDFRIEKRGYVPKYINRAYVKSGQKAHVRLTMESID